MQKMNGWQTVYNHNTFIPVGLLFRDTVAVLVDPTKTPSDWLVPVMMMLKSSTASNSESISPLTEIQLVPIVVGIGPGAMSILVSANEKSSGSGKMSLLY